MHNRAKTVFGATAAFGVITAAALMAPISASAAAAPTFDIVPLRTAFGPVQLTGTAEAGDTVSLYEYAYVWGYDWDQSRLSQHPSADYSDGIGYVTTTADASGRWSITRDLDSGHVFMVGTDDGYSQIRKAALRVKADLNVSVSGTTVNFSVNADPSQPGLPVEIQRYSNGSWTRVASGATSESATFTGSAENQPAGTSYYRAFLEDDEDKDWADKSNYIVANYSENQPATVGSGGSNGVPPSNPTPTPEYDTGTVKPSTPPSSKPPTTAPSSKPPTTTPSSKPPTTPPTSKPPTTTPPPAGPAAGSVQFTRIQYNAPGKDSRKNKSINGEYFKLTNKTKKTINLKGWTVRDRAGNLYRFTSTYYLRAGKSVTVHTGKGSNKSTVRYWGKTKHVWNNGGDTATLRTDTSKTIDTCRWTKPGKGYSAC